MSLRADDGTLLQSKDPIVLSAEGEPISTPTSSSSSQDFRSGKFDNLKVFKLNGLWTPFVFVGLAGLLTVGAVFIGGFLTVFLALCLVRSLFKRIA
jgi:hypothetical protein